MLKALAQHALDPPVLLAFTPEAISRTLWAYASLGVDHEPLARHLAQRLLQHPPTAQSLTNTLWALATLKVQDRALLDALADQVMQPGVFSRSHLRLLCKVMWAYGTLHHRQPELAAWAAGFLTSPQLAQATARDLSNVLWAYASLQFYDEALLTAVGRRIIQADVLSTLRGQDISAIAWSFATLNVYDEEVLHALAEAATQKAVAATFTAEHIADTLWAYAKWTYYDQPLLSALTRHLLFTSTVLGTFGSQHIATTISAISSFGGDNEVLAEALARRCMEPGVLSTLNGKHISAILASLAKLQEARQDKAKQNGNVASTGGVLDTFVTALGNTTTSPEVLLTFGRAELTQTARAMVHLAVAHKPLMEALSTRVLDPRVRRQMKSDDIFTVLWAFSTLDVHNTLLTTALVQDLLAQGTRSSLRATVGSAWALAVVGSLEDSLIHGLITRVHSRDCSHIQLSQLHQLFVHVELNAEVLPQSQRLLQTIQPFRTRCQTVFLQHFRRTKPVCPTIPAIPTAPSDNSTIPAAGRRQGGGIGQAWGATVRASVDHHLFHGNCRRAAQYF